MERELHHFRTSPNALGSKAPIDSCLSSNDNNYQVTEEARSLINEDSTSLEKNAKSLVKCE